MDKKRDKKGELTTTQLVTLIVLIVSFIIILFLIFRLNLGQTTDQEICHNSVVLKGQSKLTSGPLDCKTNYICISGGSDCSNLQASETIKIDPGNKTQLLQAIADKMSECWWMFGEGKINYGEGLTSTSVHYAICSIISFDKNIQGKIQQISYNDFYTYLKNNKKTDSQTYLQYLYGINDISLFNSEENIKVDITNDKILTNEKYSVITGIDNNILSGDNILKTYLIPTSGTQERTTSESKDFITKA